MSDQELKPCPFCGSKSLPITASFGEWWVICNGCRAGTDMCSSREEVFYRWNTRTPDPMLEEFAGALEEIARCLSHGLQDCRASIIAKDMLGKYQQSKVQP